MKSRVKVEIQPCDIVMLMQIGEAGRPPSDWKTHHHHHHPLRRNILLLFAKIAAFVISSSYSVLASTIDSVVDLLSQIMVALAER